MLDSGAKHGTGAKTAEQRRMSYDTDTILVLILLFIIILPSSAFASVSISEFKCESNVNFMENGWCYLSLNATAGETISDLPIELTAHRIVSGVPEQGSIRIHYMYETENNKFPWKTNGNGIAEMQVYIDNSYIMNEQYQMRAYVSNLAAVSNFTVIEPRPYLDNVVSGMSFLSGQVVSIIFVIIAAFFLTFIVLVFYIIIKNLLGGIWDYGGG